MSSQDRIAIVGGGVIGLSVAWELSQRNHQVTLFEVGQLGRKASWAGAGILSPSNSKTVSHPLDKLMGLGSDLHRDWTGELLEASGIDNGYHQCGGLYVARTIGEKAALQGQLLNWDQYEIAYRRLADVAELDLAANLNVGEDHLLVAVPGESQICNPDHLKALAAACRKRGVELIENCDVNFRLQDDLVVVDSYAKPLDRICFCAGAWTTPLMADLGIKVPLIPVRGQMLLFKLDARIFESIINEGSRYIVPRADGFVLVGSTTEEVGFDESTTEEKLNELMQFATSLVPALNENTLENSWAGLRPASHDGFPFMGVLPGTRNGYVATGHFKAGLQMSPAVAVIMADLIEGKDSIMDVSPFNPGRLNLSDALQE